MKKKQLAENFETKEIFSRMNDQEIIMETIFNKYTGQTTSLLLYILLKP